MELLKALKGDLTEYTSIPFWSWNNELDEGELVRQIREFKAQSVDGFIMHARTGLKTEYLGEKWFSCVDACLKEARRLGMHAWVYDENGWPSGFVEGRLLKEGNYVQYLTHEVKDAFDADADAVYAERDGKLCRVVSGDKPGTYHCIYIKEQKSFADILNPSVVSAFIKATHDEYYKRFKDSFGREIKGFFTDEPQYYRYATPFSRVLPDDYKNEYGEDIFDGLAYLFVGGTAESEAFRYKFYSLLNKLFTERFYKPLYDWCTDHNCLLTGHAVEETFLGGQLWACAGAMPSYVYEHIPGIDWLGRTVGTAMSPKQVGSAAQQFGKKQVLTETFGCSGWDTTPRELRWIAECQYVGGLNMMCQHLVSYSLKGQAKGDYPPSFSRHNPWINKSKDFNDYFKRLSYILCNTDEQADTLVVHAMHSAYLTYERSRDSDSIRALEVSFRQLTEDLTARGVQFHYGDERIMKDHARVEGGVLFVGRCAYRTVVLPDMDNIDASTLRLLQQFEAGGGKLCRAGRMPVKVDGLPAEVCLKAAMPYDALQGAPGVTLPKDTPLRVTVRKSGVGEFLYIYNADAKKAADCTVQEGYALLDFERVALRQCGTQLSVPPMGSVMLMKTANASDCAPSAPKASSARDVTAAFIFAEAEDNCLTLDTVSISKDGTHYEKPEYIHSANERLIKEQYNGKLWIKYTFESSFAPAVTLVLEQMDYVSFTVNGKEAVRRQSDWDVFFSECTADNLRAGSNEIIACINYTQKDSVRHILYGKDVMESLKNCVVIDTEIESIYVLGGFSVDGARRIVPQTAPKGMDGLEQKGFPNFAGNITFAGDITLSGGRALLTLDGRYMIAEVKVNGKAAGSALLTDTVDISDCAVKGKNRVEITLTPSLRNMMGPHHFKPDPEPLGIGHFQFDFRGSWNPDGTAPLFTPEYQLVPFGLTRVTVSEE